VDIPASDLPWAWRGSSCSYRETKAWSGIRVCSLPPSAKTRSGRPNRLANQLHLEGLRAEFDYEGKSLKSQMRRADKLKASNVLILGGDEMKRGKAVLRNMADKSQEEIPMDDIAGTLKTRLFGH